MVWDIKRHIIMPLALVTMVGSTMIVAHAAERELPYKVNVTFITASDMDTMTDNGTRGGAARLAAVVELNALQIRILYLHILVIYYSLLLWQGLIKVLI